MKLKKMYNIIFPIWFLYFIPSYMWIIILVGNFVIDSVVIGIALKKEENFKSVYQKSIFKTWAIGLISDFIGSLALLGLYVLLFDVLSIDINLDVIYFPGCTIFAIPGVIIAGILIYFLNKKFSFKELDEDKRKWMCKIMALATAPYIMLIPLYF